MHIDITAACTTCACAVYCRRQQQHAFSLPASLPAIIHHLSVYVIMLYCYMYCSRPDKVQLLSFQFTTVSVSHATQHRQMQRVCLVCKRHACCCSIGDVWAMLGVQEECTCSWAARADSTTCRVAANSSWKTAGSWKKSEQKRYSEVAVSISSLFTLLKSICRQSTPLLIQP